MYGVVLVCWCVVSVAAGVIALAVVLVRREQQHKVSAFPIPPLASDPSSNLPPVPCAVTANNWCTEIGFNAAQNCTPPSNYVDSQCRINCSAYLNQIVKLGTSAFPSATPPMGIQRLPNASDPTSTPDEPGHNEACRLGAAMLSRVYTIQAGKGGSEYSSSQAEEQGWINFYTSIALCIFTSFSCE